MSQKAKRGSVSIDEKEKGRTDSPVKDMKKKAAANAEKERMAAEKVAEQTGPKAAPAQHGGKAPQAAQTTGKTTPVAVQNTGKPAAAQSAGKTTPVAVQSGGKPAAASPAQTSGKATAAAPAPSLKDIPLPAEKTKEEAKADKAEKPKTVAPEPAKASESAKQNGNEKEREMRSNGDGAGGGRNGVGAASDRAALNGNTVKTARTPETPRPASNKTPSGDDKPPAEEAPAADALKGDTKVLKMREEYAPSPMKLRSADRSTPDPTRAGDAAPAAQEPGADDKKLEDVKEDQEKEDADDSEKEPRGEEGEAGGARRDTNFSKSRIKISPYRRSTRLHDSVLANYTGNNTTMEMDISESLSELASTSAADPALADASYTRGLRHIRGRRSYKLLGEFVPRPASRTDKYTAQAATRPTVHVVGRKRRPLDEDESAAYTAGEEVTAVKRMRLLDRMVSPFASLVRRRVVPSSTPLPVRRSQPIVGINTDLPLHGPVGIEPESLPLQEESEELKTVQPESPATEEAVEVREDARQKCALM